MRNFLNILSVVVLFAGVVAGVVLVQEEQDIRRSAAPEDKVEICHKTGNGEEFQKISISQNGVDAHLGHGDKLSGCDPQPRPEDDQPLAEETEQVQEQNQEQQNTEIAQADTPTQPTDVPVQTQEPVATEQPQATENSNNNNIKDNTDDVEEVDNNNNNTNDNSSSSSGEDFGDDNVNDSNDSSIVTTTVTTNKTTNTFIAPLNKNTFNFKLRLQGINNKSATKNVTLTFFKSGSQQTRNVSINSDNTGVYSGNISGLEAGNYEVLVKVDSYLAKRFRNVNVGSGASDWDWSGSVMTVGDFDNNNVFNILDIGMILAVYNQKNVTVNASNRQYDVNADNFINESDIDIVLSGYSRLSISGDN